MENKVYALVYHNGYDNCIEVFNEMEDIDEYIYRMWTCTYNIVDLMITTEKHLDNSGWSKKLEHKEYSTVWSYYSVYEREIL